MMHEKIKKIIISFIKTSAQNWKHYQIYNFLCDIIHPNWCSLQSACVVKRMYTAQPIIIYGSCYVNQELFYKCLIPLKRLRTYCAGIFNNCDRKSILTLMDVQFSSVNPRSESRKYSCIIHISEDTAITNHVVFLSSP